MRFSLRTKIVLMCLLIALNIIFRYPTFPHELGWDSFSVHLMAESISKFGYAKWWIHPSSITGSYPYSTSPSAVPFVLSGMSQCLRMDTELVILVYSTVLCVFSILTAYIMAGVIWDNDFLKFLVAMIFSTSQGMVTFSTWTANARTLFVMSLPLFIYLLLKARTFKVRCGILTFIILALFLVTHHYFYFTLSVILSYLIIVTIYMSGRYIKSIRIPENLAGFALLVGFLIMFSIPFFTRTLSEADPGGMAGGRYAWMFFMIQSYTRYLGFSIVFVISGYIYLTFKRNKRFEEWFLLLTIICLAQFLYITTYMKWFIVPFASLLIGIAIINVAKIGGAQKRKYAVPFVIILLLLSTMFTGYYQYLHFLNDPDPNKRYMEERTYVGGLWIKYNIDKDKNMISGSDISSRVFSVSEVPTLTGIGAADLAYDFQDPDKLEIKQIYSTTSVDFYFHDPYKAVNHSYTDSQVLRILSSDINDYGSFAYRLTSPSWFNLSYFVENRDVSDIFSRSVQQTKDCLYDNGKIHIWDLD